MAHIGVQRTGELLAILAVFLLSPAIAADPTAQEALSDAISPVQKNVEFDKVDADQIKDCKVESTKQDDWAGWYVYGPEGQILRRFADTNNDKSIDLWCYYQGGIEIYRDIDSNFNGKADQYRWLGTAGSRWGIDSNEDGIIESWKRISAEEVTQQLVFAISNDSLSTFESLLLTDTEAKDLQISKDLLEKVQEKLSSARKGFSDFVKGQDAITKESRWAHFVASQPGIVTSSVSSDGRGDVVVYENVVAMFDTGTENGQLHVGTMVQAGNAWRLVELPRVVGGGEEIAQNVGLFFSSPIEAPEVAAAGAGQMNANVQKLVNDLESIESSLSKATSVSEKTALHKRQADILQALVESARNREESTMWVRQMTESVSAAIHSGEFAGGLDYLDKLRRGVRGKDNDLAAFVEFEFINADYGSKLQSPGADFAKIQDAKINDLTDFVEEYPTAKESAKAMMDLALSKEFENEDTAATLWYRKVITNFPNQPEAKKAKGAITRLDAIGKTIPFVGKTIDGRTFDLSRYRNRPVIIHYWATWCETCKQDMKLYRKLQAQYAKDNLMVVGVNVDTQKSVAEAYLKQNRATVDWPQLFDEGGLDSSELANILGVQTLPTTLVIDKQGKVAKTNVVAADLEDEIKQIVR